MLIQRRVFASTILVVSACMAPAAAQGDLDFAGRVLETSEKAKGLKRVDITDLNGDALPDAMTSGKAVLLWRNLGRGHLVPLPSVELPVGQALMADLDGDSQSSVLTFSSQGIRAREMLDDFLFGEEDVLSTASLDPWWCEAVDLNGDAATDLVGSFNPPAEFRTWLNDGSGGLEAPIVAAPAITATQFTVGDVNTDGTLDLVAAGNVVMLGIGDGTFVVQPALGVPFIPLRGKLGDLDSDGIIDLVAGGVGSTEILPGAPGGVFVLSEPMPANGGWVLDLADADGDEDLDVLAQAALTGEIAVHLVNGTTLEALPGAEPLAATMYGAFADFDQDGRSGALIAGYIIPEQVVAEHIPGDGTGDLSVRDKLIEDTLAERMLAADVDGDGMRELVLQLQFTGDLVVHELPGDGTIGVAGPITATGGVGALSATAYLDADDLEDVIIATNLEIKPFLSNGDGTFQGLPSVVLPTPAPFVQGDIDGDLDTDLLAITDPPTWYANLGDGTYGPATPTTLPSFGIDAVGSFTLADLDSDGLVELVSGQFTSAQPTLRYYRGLGDGAFEQAVGIGSPDVGCAAAVHAVDIDADGILDVVAYGHGFGDLGTVVRGEEGGGFSTPQLIDGGTIPQDVLTPDLNGDGLLDIVFVDDGFARNIYSLQLADGMFTTSRLAFLGTLPIDLDADPQDEMLRAQLGVLDPGLYVYRVSSTDAFVNTGHATFGSVGLPLLEGAGTITPGEKVTLRLRAAASAAPALLTLGLASDLQSPFSTPGRGRVEQLTLGLVINGDGAATIVGRWPKDAAAGLAVYCQAWIQDDHVDGGLSSSNIVQLIGD